MSALEPAEEIGRLKGLRGTALDFIESTAGQVAAELARRGVAPDQRVVVTIEPDDWIAEARCFSRAERRQQISQQIQRLT